METIQKISTLWTQAENFFLQQDYERANSLYQQILQLQPDHFATLESLGILHAKCARHDIALEYFQKLLHIKPNLPSLHYNVALTYLKLYNSPQAILHLQQACEVNYEPACQMLGQVYYENHRYEEAIAIWQQYLVLGKSSSQLFYQLAATYHQLQNHDQTVFYARQSMHGTDCSAQLYFAIGHILRECQALEDALYAYQQACHLQPDFAAAYDHCGVVLQFMTRPQEALQYYNQSIALSPTPVAYGNRAQSLLMSGNLQRGFAEYEWRTQIPELKGIFQWFARKPRWQGEFFSGKLLLIHDEQGMGDTLQFIRYLPQVKARGGVVAVSAKKPLLRLLATAPGVDYVVEHTEEALSKLPFDLSLPLMSLPYIFGTTLATISSTSPYLTPEQPLLRKWKNHLTPLPATKLRVGLVWAGNQKHTQALCRTCGLQALAPLATVSDITYYSLQIGPGSKELSHPPAGLQILDYTDNIQDFADTAAFIANLDLVISVDTAVAHLAGALGTPVWTLLPYSSEWRWLIERTDTPWYPTMRLFRQAHPQDWQTLLQYVASELEIYKKIPYHL